MFTMSERLKELRKNRGITQSELAKAIGTVERNYRRYEAGVSEPGISVVIALADYFNVSLDYLVGRTDNPKVASNEEETK